MQSYFIALRKAALSSEALAAFIDSIKNLSTKRDVIIAYESCFASLMQSAKLRCEVLFAASGKSYNPSLFDWRTLIESGLPFVKLAALRNASKVFVSDWRKVLQSEGFDHRLAEQALAAKLDRRPR